MPDTTTDTVVPAAPGYSIAYVQFHDGKPSTQAVADIVQQNSYPVVAWKQVGDHLEPLTFAPAPVGVRYLLGGGKIYCVDDLSQRWSDHSQWIEQLHRAWRQSQGAPIVDAPRTGLVVNL